MSETDKKNVFPQSDPLDTQNAVLTTPLNSFRQNIENFQLIVRNDEKEDDFFQKNSFFRNCSLGYVECSFDDPADNLMNDKKPKTFRSRSENDNKNDNFSKNFSLKTGFFLQVFTDAKIRKNDGKTEYFEKNAFLQKSIFTKKGGRKKIRWYPTVLL